MSRSRHEPIPSTAGTRQRGLALIAILVALSILLALTAPFLISMGHGDAQSRAILDEKQVDLLSASARDVVLARAKLTAFGLDETPGFDSRDEYADRLELPEPFGDLASAGGGRNALQAEVWDLQRRIDINSATPLVVANLLGLAVRLSADHEPDADELRVDGDVSAFEDSGLLVVDREVIRYGARDGTTFRNLQRGVLAEFGFRPAVDHALPEGELVLDARAFAIALYPILEDGDKTTRQPYAVVRDAQRIDMLGFPPLRPEQLDVLERHCCADAMRENSATWGKPERVFEIRFDPLTQTMALLVRSAQTLGGGALVRVHSGDGKLSEYAMVASTRDVPGERGSVNLPRRVDLVLLTPLVAPFQPIDTWIEPLVPVPVNVNTASREVLAALVAHVRRRPGARASGDHDQVRVVPPFVGSRRADEIAGELIALRGDVPLAAGSGLDASEAPRPFDGWEDFARRWLLPVARAAESQQQRRLWMQLYEALQLGCVGSLDIGTVPIVFHSSPLVGYRASAARYRGAGLEVARLEREGTAIALPGQALFWGAATQEQIEEFVRLDRLTPYWQTFPINTAAILPADRGTIPAPRAPGHLLAPLFPDAGFGQARFPDRAGGEGSFRAQPSSTPFRGAPANAWAHESFFQAQNPEGRDAAQEGPYELRNNGPRAGAGRGAQAAPSFDHSSVQFPFTTRAGLTNPHAVSFWFRLESLEPQALYDLATTADEPERNRIGLQLRDGKLLFEVLDEAGLDPDPSQSRGAMPRTAGTWELVLSEHGIEPRTWYHVSLSALGNRPGQLTLLVDGVPRGEAIGRTWLVAPIQTWSPDYNVPVFTEDRARFNLQVRVEDTEGFPDQGILRVGLELFEYSSKDRNTFYCRYANSVGGRAARVSIHEFKVDIPKDESGEPREDLLKIVGRADQDAVAPDHPIGAAVELYGYSIPVYPQTTLQPGGARLSDQLGVFAIARVINDSNTRPIEIAAGNFTVPIGKGLDETYTSDLELGDPAASADFPPSRASDRIAAAFPSGGGYALLVQRRMRWRLDTLNPGQLSTPAEVGGVEVIRYASRSGSRLEGISRAATLPNRVDPDRNGFFAQGARRFVVEWERWVRARDVWVQELPLYQLYVVPISIPVTGTVNSGSELVEWVQLLQVGGDETNTEWVRFNVVADGRHLVRAEQRAWDRLRQRLTAQTVLDDIGVPRGGRDLSDVLDVQRQPYPVPYDDGDKRIGWVERIEIDFPAIYAARLGLGFRGDPFTGTTSHVQAANTSVLPVHRFEFDWPAYGLSASRAGRDDRVALVQGTRRDASQVPAVEWHTVNWAVRHYEWDAVNEESTAGRSTNDNTERRGDWPFQLVAFKGEVRVGMLGGADDSRRELRDMRVVDRLVKFPSGELPAADADRALCGGAVHQDLAPMRGVVDEIAAIARMTVARPLDQVIEERSERFFVRPDVFLTPVGGLVDAKPAEAADWGQQERYPEHGGLLMVDGEVMAFEAVDAQRGEVRIARNGRGLLGTTARAHDEGALVMFLEQVPAAILTAGLRESDHEIEVQNLGALPRDGGLVLVGRELLHYAWTRGETTLAMPAWRDPERDGQAPRGLFRGRFGTVPVSAAAGEAVIWFPFRYWDRARDRAEDPELAYFQCTLDQGPTWLDGFGWRETDTDPLVDVHCHVRLDGRGRFSDDPAATDGLFRFTDGEPDGKPNPIGRAASRFEARFSTVYRSGAFDPERFMLQSWKRSPTVQWFVLTYQGEGRILGERISAR